MKKLLSACLILFCFNGFAQILTPFSGLKSKLSNTLQPKDYIPNTIIIKFKPSNSLKNKSIATLKSALNIKSAPIIQLTEKFPSTGKSVGNQLKTETDNLSLIYELKYSGPGKIEDVINELLRGQHVEYAEPSYISHLSYQPNDPLILSQNYLAQIKAFDAWNLTRNSSDVIIAIVDSGSDVNHQDLAGNIYINSLDPINGIDDDGDGYIDNYHGWDFAGANSSDLKGDNDPNVKSKLLEHGVHVSGLASSISDNNIGIASVAFNAKLLIVKAAADDNSTSIFSGYEGIKYAADHGAQIINCSWGGRIGGQFGKDVIDYAISKGCLIVAAAGNDNTSIPDYPAAYPGVLAVANVNGSDLKSQTSNYGPHVGIAAPGVTILSTLYDNKFGNLSGTSMSAPIVSSAAALVKSYFPSLSMEQVAQKLRVTADNINDKNSAFEGQLGSGRLNVYRSLTQLSPSIRSQKITIKQNESEIFSPGDTVQVYLDIKNFLEPAYELKLKLSSSSPNVEILNPDVTLGTLLSLESKTLIGPFYVYITPQTAENTQVLFRLDYTANADGYRDAEHFPLTVALDYINFKVNQIGTSITNTGKVGYSRPNAENGLGFEYNGKNLLYEASLLIGNSPARVSNNARINSSSSDKHFAKKDVVRRIKTTSGDFEGYSSFTDTINPSGLNVLVKHRQIAYEEVPYEKFSIIEYEIQNNGQSPLVNLYAGLFTDWDINPGSSDLTVYDHVLKLAYQHGKANNTPFVGVKLLSQRIEPAYYPMDGASDNDFLQDGTFSSSEKFKSISSGIKAESLGATISGDYDIAFSTGYGPISLAPGQSMSIGFAFIAGDNIEDLKKSAIASQHKYDLIEKSEPDTDEAFKLNPVYPNPVSGTSYIEFTITQKGHTTLHVYDLIGRKVKTLLNKILDPGNYIVDIQAGDYIDGIYIYQLKNNSRSESLKMIVTK